MGDSTAWVGGGFVGRIQSLVFYLLTRIEIVFREDLLTAIY